LATSTSKTEVRTASTGDHRTPTASTTAKKVPFVQRKEPVLPSSSLPLGDRFDELAREAQFGEADIGYALGMELRACLQLDGRYAQLQVNLASQPERADNIAVHVDVLDRQRAHCQGLSSTELQDYGHWIELAAKRGSVAAQIAYPTIFAELLSSPEHALDEAWISDYKANSLNFLQSAAHSGSVDALSQLAHIYRDGLMAPKDTTMAYAYAYAVSRSGLVVSTPKLLEMWAQAMTPEEVAAAQQRGAEIYQACCE
jgi:TPR repeat protein